MSNFADRLQVQEAFTKAGSKWVLDYWKDNSPIDFEKNLDHVCKGIEEFQGEYERRFQERPDPFQLLDANREKGSAFFQFDTFAVSVEMRIMIWRILLGFEIVEVEFKYDAGGKLVLLVRLKSPAGQDDPVYTGRDLRDFGVFRHFASIWSKGRFVLHGYHPSGRFF